MGSVACRATRGASLAPAGSLDDFVEQHVLRFRRALKNELRAGRKHDPILHSLQFEIEDRAEVMFLQRTEHDNLVDAIHELWRELSARSFDGRAIDFLIDFRVMRILRAFARSETNAAGN